MDSSATKQLKKRLGLVSYQLFKRYLRNVKLKIDAEKKLVTIINSEGKFVISFDEIEQLVNV